MSETRNTSAADERPDAAPDAPLDVTSARTHPSGPLDVTQATVGQISVGHVSNVPPANSPAANAPPPQVIAHYELVEKIGEGGMGAVYKGWHPKMQRFGAVKLLPPQVMRNPALVARFEHEVSLAAQLSHPHIVLTHDAGEEAGLHYLVLEYLDGTDLSKLVKTKGPLSLLNALTAIRQAALGLQHAHERGLVHRDIKPANLMLHRPNVAVTFRVTSLPHLTSERSPTLRHPPPRNVNRQRLVTRNVTATFSRRPSGTGRPPTQPTTSRG